MLSISFQRRMKFLLKKLSAVYGLMYVYTDPSVETLWMEEADVNLGSWKKGLWS